MNSKYWQPHYIKKPVDEKLSKLARGKPRYVSTFNLNCLMNANFEELHSSARVDIISILGRHLINPQGTLDEKVFTFLKKASQGDDPTIKPQARNWIENFDFQLREYEENSRNPIEKLIYRILPGYAPRNKAQYKRKDYQELISNAELDGSI